MWPMQDASNDQPAETKAKAKAQTGLDRAERIRERVRLSQTIAAQRARIEATGGKPDDDEVARMVNEFHTQGGQVTICPPPDESVTDDEPGPGKRR